MSDLSGIIEQIEACGFECEAGPIEKNTGFMQLKSYCTKAPEFQLGSVVWKRVSVEVDGEKFTKVVKGVVTRSTGVVTDNGRGAYWKYMICASMPQEWHSPRIIAQEVPASELYLSEDAVPA